jgi:pimeloyl-ACP methyl ester carboxylesterase
MLTVEKWLEGRLVSATPPKALSARLARLAEVSRLSVQARWFSVPLASGIGVAALLTPASASTSRRALVILLNSYGPGGMASEWPWISSLLAKGLSVLSVELDGHGEGASLWDAAASSRSIPLLLHKLYSDSASAFLVRSDDLPRCFLMGNSLAGTMALVAATRAEVASVVSGVVVVSPMVALPRSRGSKTLKAGKTIPRALGFRKRVGVDPVDQVRAFLAENVERQGLFKKVRVPVLWMHGARDRLVPVEKAMPIMTSIPAALFSHIDEKRGHSLMKASAEISNYAANFIEQCVDGGNVSAV